MPAAGYQLRFQHRDQWYTLAPPWLRTGVGELYMYTLELARDLLEEKAFQAVMIRFPGQGDPSQLPYLSYDRQMVQGLAETAAEFATRLRSAFQTWNLAGSRVAVLGQIQAYLQGLAPGTPSTAPWLTIVTATGSAPFNLAVWDQLLYGDAIGATPRKTKVSFSNFAWDHKQAPWRTWLILPQTLVVSSSGTGASTTAVQGGSLANPGAIGAATAKSGVYYPNVWIPAPVAVGGYANAPWLTVTGLSGTLAPGMYLVLSGSSHAGNNGTFQIVTVVNSTTVVVANPNGIAPDTSLTWSVGQYPFLSPAPVWGAPGWTLGQGVANIAPLDYGSYEGGLWGPSLPATSTPTLAWGLQLQSTVLNPTPPTSEVVVSIRSLVKQWKSAGTYYESIIVAFDAGTGAAGSAYSALSAQGSGNPDGSFGGHGKIVSFTSQDGGAPITYPNAWGPNRLISSPFDCYCQGSGTFNNCSVTNVT
jgi:hypothetical protein